LDVFFALSKQNMLGLIFFAESTVTGTVYLDMEEFLVPILEEEGPDNMLFQQDGALPHSHKEVTDLLNSKFPGKCIGRGGSITWPPRSSDITPLDFFL
jgi:hypothetical protein